VIDVSELYRQVVIEHLDIVLTGTFFFFIAAFVLLIILSFFQIILESHRKKIAVRKREYIDQINHYLFFDKNEIMVSSLHDYYALAEAIAELHNFVAKVERVKIFALVEALDLDYYLLERYKESFFSLKKKYLFMKLLFLYSPRLKTFYAESMQDEHSFDMVLYALFSYADLAEDKDDLKLILTTLEKNYEKGISLKFCEFIFSTAFQSASTSQIQCFLKEISTEEHTLTILKSIIEAIGDIKYVALKEEVVDFSVRYQHDSSFMASYIRALSKLGIKDCELIKEAYLNHDTVIRINLSKFALSLCPDSLQLLYLYMFDPNYYVRRNFFEAMKAEKITRQEILSLVQKRSPLKSSDPFFLDALNSFFPEVSK